MAVTVVARRSKKICSPFHTISHHFHTLRNRPRRKNLAYRRGIANPAHRSAHFKKRRAKASTNRTSEHALFQKGGQKGTKADTNRTFTSTPEPTLPVAYARGESSRRPSQSPAACGRAPEAE